MKPTPAKNDIPKEINNYEGMLSAMSNLQSSWDGIYRSALLNTAMEIVKKLRWPGLLRKEIEWEKLPD